MCRVFGVAHKLSPGMTDEGLTLGACVRGGVVCLGCV
eukprot:COSAG02_NODE_1394_length_12906_cov_3.129304_13_plen_36_part_01